MHYPHLPAIGTVTLPHLEEELTRAQSSRRGHRPGVVFVHRWGGGSLAGVLAEFLNPANEASSHFVYAGELGHDAGRCVQMVPLAAKAWTEANYNPIGISIECADAIWLGKDPHGFARTARIVGWLLRHEGLPDRWLSASALAAGGRGFCRHADGGSAGGGHTACPTTDLELWHQFVERVRGELAHGGYRDVWAR